LAATNGYVKIIYRFKREICMGEFPKNALQKCISITKVPGKMNLR